MAKLFFNHFIIFSFHIFVSFSRAGNIINNRIIKLKVKESGESHSN